MSSLGRSSRADGSSSKHKHHKSKERRCSSSPSKQHSRRRSSSRSPSKSCKHPSHSRGHKHRSGSPSKGHKNRSRSPSKGHKHRSRSLSRDHKHRSRSPSRDHKHRRCSLSGGGKHRSPDNGSKHRKSGSSSSDSSSSSESDTELRLLRRLEAERERLREQRRKEKEQLKAQETPQEKRARRLREKAAKERRRRSRMGWDAEYQGYTDQDNPFGDAALTDTFVWGKKLQAAGVRATSREELERAARQRQLDTKAELEKVKARRLEREAERAAREAEAAAQARAREAALYSNWERQEDGFHLQQARLRTEIRIRDGRAKPIDLLAWYVAREHEAEALEMHEPYTYLRGLSAADLQDLLADVAVYRSLEPAHAAYWDDVETIASDELAALRRREGAATAEGAAGREAVHRAVADDVSAVFRGKSAEQLDALRRQVEAKLARPADNLDVTYWESLLGQLRAHQARARLRDRHRQNLKTKLQLLKKQQGVQADGAPEEGEREKREKKEVEAPEEMPGTPPREAEREEDASGSESETEAARSQYSGGRYSPPPLSPRALEPGTIVTEPAEDRQRLAYLRARALHRLAPQAAAQSAAPAAAPLAALQRSCPAAPEDAPFAGEHALPAEPCLWADKYRPRKPRYFNRVHTGFEWNKYNQTHYDMDNPPPKIVQGYKFNIFYPDLLEPGRTPTFSLAPVDDGEFAVLRFSAGPPYEDIAFKVVNREWEYSYKRGFRCHFHNNIFQLWFHFKRYRYRR